MGLKSTSGGDSKKNFFVNSGKIKKIDVEYQFEAKSGNIFDVKLSAVIPLPKQNGEMYDKTFALYGNYKVEGDDIVGWGSVMKIKIFLSKFYKNAWETSDDGVIPEEVVNACLGKEVFLLNYRTAEKNDNGYQQYNTFDNVGLTEEEVVKAFLAQNSKGYPKDFAPYKEDPDNMPYPTNTNSDTEEPPF